MDGLRSKNGEIHFMKRQQSETAKILLQRQCLDRCIQYSIEQTATVSSLPKSDKRV